MVTDVERTDVEFVCSTLGCTPVQRADSLVTSSMGGGCRQDQGVTPTAQADDDHGEIGLALLPDVHRCP
jgi:hypothetical protein